MSLTNCKECGKEISSNAVSCPSCGNPISPILIEQTSKKWKKRELIFSILCAIGIIMFFTSFGFSKEFSPVKFMLGLLLGIVGAIGTMSARFGAWWNNR
jgi:uncharacterized membrane protein YvbJ